MHAETEGSSTMSVPCRASADLRIWLREREKAALEHEGFDETDPQHYEQILCKQLRKPLFRLLNDLLLTECATGIEGLNKDKALETFIKDAKAIREACGDLWNDL